MKFARVSEYGGLFETTYDERTGNYTTRLTLPEDQRPPVIDREGDRRRAKAERQKFKEQVRQVLRYCLWMIFSAILLIPQIIRLKSFSIETLFLFSIKLNILPISWYGWCFLDPKGYVFIIPLCLLCCPFINMIEAGISIYQYVYRYELSWWSHAGYFFFHFAFFCISTASVFGSDYPSHPEDSRRLRRNMQHEAVVLLGAFLCCHTLTGGPYLEFKDLVWIEYNTYVVVFFSFLCAALTWHRGIQLFHSDAKSTFSFLKSILISYLYLYGCYHAIKAGFSFDN